MAAAYRSLALRLLPTVLAGATLAACASTAPSVSTAGLRPAQTARIADRDRARSLYGLFLAGQAALENGSSREAADYLARASAMAPDATFLKERAFDAALQAGEIQQAAAAAPDAADASTDIQRLGRLTRIVDAIAANRGKEALALLSGDPMPAPHGQIAALLKPWAAASVGDWETALATPPLSPDRSMNALFGVLGRAQLMERAERFDEAEALYKTLTERDGVFGSSYGVFLERRGRKADAVAVYDRMLARRQEPETLAARGRAAAGKAPPPVPAIREGAAQALIGPAAQVLAQRQYKRGLAYLRLALRLDPKLDEAWVLVGDVVAADGDVVAAREAYRKVGPASVDYATARGRLAWSLQNEDDSAGALKMARETVQALPDSQEALAVYADLLRENERYDEAIAAMDTLIQRAGPNVGWRLYHLRGIVNERAGRWDAAQVDLQAALRLNPDSAETLNYLGYGWANRGQNMKLATEMLQRAVTLEPRSGAIIDSLGWARYRAGDYRQAVRDLEQAVMLEPSDPDVNDHLGDAYWRIGRRLEAQFQWRRVLTLNPTKDIRAAVEIKLVSGLPPAVPRTGAETSARLETPDLARQ